MINPTTAPQWYGLLAESHHDNKTIFVLYCLCHMLSTTFQRVINSIRWCLRNTRDERYIDQLHGFQDILVKHLDMCGGFLNKHQLQMKRHVKCLHFYTYCRTHRVHGVDVCNIDYIGVRFNHFSVLCRDLFQLWVRDFYYVYRLAQQHRISIPVPLDPVSIGGLTSWETICMDGEMELMNHPLLPHPSDFLVKYTNFGQGTTYVDKARFQYSFFRPLEGGVVFTRTPSVIPRLLPSRDDIPLVDNTEQQTIQQPFMVHVSETINRRYGKTRKKRCPTQILKETRKKHKTIHKHRPWIRVG